MLSLAKRVSVQFYWYRQKVQVLLFFGLAALGIVSCAGGGPVIEVGELNAAKTTTLQHQVLAGAYAKLLCSGIFISGREQGRLHQEDLWWLGIHDANVDYATKLVTVPTPDGSSREAAYSGADRGCVLHNNDMLVGNNVAAAVMKPASLNRTTGRKSPGLQRSKHDTPSVLQAIVDQAFEPGSDHQASGSRAIVVVQNGQVVAEKYAPGFTAKTRLPGYSLTKGVTNALVGILVGEGVLKLDDYAAMPEWSQPGDPRHTITIDQLLHMTSGLRWYENYTDLASDVFVMLSTHADFAAYAASKPANAPPGMTWEYSTGTTSILSRVVRNAVERQGDDYESFPRRMLFDRIGMTDAVLESDGSGTFDGGTFLYATAEDWAHFGLLYLNDGMGPDARVLPEGWVAYTTHHQLVPASGSQDYGALFWLVGDNILGTDFPADMFFGEGFGGQYLFIVPSRKLVIVRLGFAFPDTWDAGMFFRSVLKALPE